MSQVCLLPLTGPPAEFLSFYGLLNFYLYTLAFVYSPSKTALYGKPRGQSSGPSSRFPFLLWQRGCPFKCELGDQSPAGVCGQHRVKACVRPSTASCRLPQPCGLLNASALTPRRVTGSSLPPESRAKAAGRTGLGRTGAFRNPGRA